MCFHCPQRRNIDTEYNYMYSIIKVILLPTSLIVFANKVYHIHIGTNLVRHAKGSVPTKCPCMVLSPSNISLTAVAIGQQTEGHVI
jgi:hypothetical protein